MGRTSTGDEGRAVTVRVLLVEDHAIFRELFASSFDREPGLEVVAQAGSLAAAREALAAEPVDVAVVDLGLPDGDGTDLIGGLREKNPHAATLVLTASLELEVHARAVAAGAAGILHKSVGVGEIMDAIKRLAGGEALLSSDEVVTLLRLADRERTRSREARLAFGRLTPREWDVLHALAEGLGDKEIARKLGCGLGTVRGHGSRMLQKLGADSRLQALIYAARHGFVQIGGPGEEPR
ncbi:MAG TPA: response regulator transcription factor [Rubrobacteraceae bacterium]|nr:response regulator transcription factor [Rubrobacteraceae bacterium]